MHLSEIQRQAWRPRLETMKTVEQRIVRIGIIDERINEARFIAEYEPHRYADLIALIADMAIDLCDLAHFEGIELEDAVLLRLPRHHLSPSTKGTAR